MKVANMCFKIVKGEKERHLVERVYGVPQPQSVLCAGRRWHAMDRNMKECAKGPKSKQATKE